MKDETALGSNEVRSRLVQIAPILIAHPLRGVEMVQADEALPTVVRDAISDAFGAADVAKAIEQLRTHESGAVREAGGVLDWVWRAKVPREERSATKAAKRILGIE